MLAPIRQASGLIGDRFVRSQSDTFARFFSISRSRTAARPKMNRERVLTMDVLNPNIKVMEYAVRGPIVIRATEIEKELAQGGTRPYKDVIKANIGDCHQMGQQPLKYIRQVIALCQYPKLMDSPDFPADVKRKAQRILNGCGGKSLGSYSASNGIEAIRQDAAAYISNRDNGIASDPENIYLTAGASEGIRELLKLFVNYSKDGKPVGVLVPIPQYPLYSASIAEYGLHQIGYYLDEDKNWALDIADVKRALEEERKKSHPKVLCVLNPGNPTGQVLSKENIADIIKLAYEERLFLFADEVYQDNVYDPNCKFHSFKKVLTELGAPYSSMELASFMSVSKGYMGECGQRGAYAEVINMDPEVIKHYRKACTARLCPTTTGQAVLACVVSPPKPGDESYDEFAKDKKAVLQSLATRAKMVEETFNSIEGIKCNPVQGAMYAFPRLFLPQKAIEKARSKNQEPDFFYCWELLEKAGICVVPGSGFGQKDGTYHFRTTILPQTDALKAMLARFKDFHLKFMAEYK